MMESPTLRRLAESGGAGRLAWPTDRGPPRSAASAAWLAGWPAGLRACPRLPCCPACLPVATAAAALQAAPPLAAGDAADAEPFTVRGGSKEQDRLQARQRQEVGGGSVTSRIWR